MSPALRLAVATAAFGALHSALASLAAKRLAARAIGERRQRAFYRPFFIVQGVITTAALLLYGARLPERTLYRVHGPVAWLMRLGQIAALGYAVAAGRAVGVRRLTGLENLRAWARGGALSQSPVAQGPELDPSTGRLTASGPFRWSRHPLNLAPLPMFWLTPHMSTRRLAFNLVSTLYILLGSAHEELRLTQAYGAVYTAYKRSGPAFLLPRPAAPDRLPSPVKRDLRTRPVEVPHPARVSP